MPKQTTLLKEVFASLDDFVLEALSNAILLGDKKILDLISKEQLSRVGGYDPDMLSKLNK